jgi:hypothetical protein
VEVVKPLKSGVWWKVIRSWMLPQKELIWLHNELVLVRAGWYKKNLAGPWIALASYLM